MGWWGVGSVGADLKVGPYYDSPSGSSSLPPLSPGLPLVFFFNYF